MSPDKLVYAANQIGKFFTSQGADKAAAGIAEHIARFWDPRMRTTIIAHLEAGGAGLDPVVREAIERLRAEQRRRSEMPHESARERSREGTK
jgi:formate dehydrogenase subunit delta